MTGVFTLFFHHPLLADWQHIFGLFLSYPPTQWTMYVRHSISRRLRVRAMIEVDLIFYKALGSLSILTGFLSDKSRCRQGNLLMLTTALVRSVVQVPWVKIRDLSK